MKFVSFRQGGRDSWGVVTGESVLDFGSLYPSLRDFIASPDFGRRSELLKQQKPEIPLKHLQYLPVIPRPDKIVLVVRNYMDHHKEVLASGLQRDLSEFPPIFLRYPRSQVAHGEPIIKPLASDQLDWEGELAVVLSKGGRHIPEADAMNHIAGYAAYNDASIREYQFHAKQIAAGKNFDGTGAFGPFLVTADEVGDPNHLKLETRLNGQTVQSSSTEHMIFKIPTLVNYASRIFELLPGDVIVTGTPAGVGWSRKPPLFMKDGDIVEVEIEKVGLLRNPVVNEVARVN